MKISIFWYRRDLRLEDNTGLFKALNENENILPIFIFDDSILDELPEDDARVNFIYKSLSKINKQLNNHHASLQILKGQIDDVWEKFNKNVFKTKSDLKKILKQLKNDGKSVVANSCPGRCSTLLNFCDIGKELIPYIAEQSTSHKLNKFLPGKHIPILDNKILFEEQPDYVLILAWHYEETIIKSLKTRGLKSRFIIPLPEVKII